jgi:hypothetical protein
VRIIVDGTSMRVYGPGSRYSNLRFGEPIDATLHQSAVEQSLVLDGWTLEHFTAERRATLAGYTGVERRQSVLRLVHSR